VNITADKKCTRQWIDTKSLTGAFIDSSVQARLFTTIPILPYAIMTSSALSGLTERDNARVFVAPVTDATVAVVAVIVDI
jgi:hypothetical protein